MTQMEGASQATLRNWRVAVVGAGPSGLYGAEALMKRGAQVDLFEEQFMPFGLVRYGVAPDHQKIKRTQVVFERILARPELRLYCNVTFGRDLSLQDLLENYDQVLFTVGSPGARALGLEGERLEGSVSATELVNWYNGHPRYQHAAPDLSHQRAVVVGMGNVAIDVARILTRNPDELASTDISESALSILRTSRIQEVVLLGRRGPNQAKFDLKEVRELAALPGVEVLVDGYASRRKTERSEFIASFPRVGQNDPGQNKRVIFHFCVSPRRVLGAERVEGIVVERNHLVESAASMKAVGSGQQIEIATGLVVRAIGYQGRALPGVPFCDDTATVYNREGRVLEDADGPVVPRLYVAGWIKRGPTGLIGTNKSCAASTVELMEQDLDQVGPLHDPRAIVTLLAQRGVRFLTKQDVQALDAYELEQGRARGKVREKLVSLKTALEVLQQSA